VTNGYDQSRRVTKKISCIQIYSVYLTPQGLPKYIYLSPPLIFPTTSNRIRTKKTPGVNHSGRCSHTLNGTDVLEISLFGSIVVKHIVLFVVKLFISGIQIHIWMGSAHHENIRKVPWRTRNNFRILNRS
jgi:hypothetical protein